MLPILIVCATVFVASFIYSCFKGGSMLLFAISFLSGMLTYISWIAMRKNRKPGKPVEPSSEKPAMERTEALRVAAEVARLVHNGVHRVMHTPTKDIPLLAMLPLFKLGEDAKNGKDLDFNTLKFRIAEIIIYGSAADENRKKVGDVDMMIFDNGFCSPFFQCEPNADDWYSGIGHNLRLLLNGWLGYGEVFVSDILDTFDNDLHVFSVEFFKSKTVREEIAKKHKDPRFFQNAFSSILRYDRAESRFVPADIGYFERKYGTDLTDLRT